MQLRATEDELSRLRDLIRGMSRDSAIYKLLKAELTALGYWKNKARGKAGPHVGKQKTNSAFSAANSDIEQPDAGD